MGSPGREACSALLAATLPACLSSLPPLSQLRWGSLQPAPAGLSTLFPRLCFLTAALGSLLEVLLALVKLGASAGGGSKRAAQPMVVDGLVVKSSEGSSPEGSGEQGPGT